MHIALLISGRAARYEVCLLPILEASTHTIDVFMSINDECCEYYETMKIRLAKWLKGLRFEKYELPSDFKFDVPHNKQLDYHHQIVDGKEVPYNQMSMYYNDNMSFKMACDYEESNGIKYDLFMKFRADICCTLMPVKLEKVEESKYLLYSIVPQCDMMALAKHKVRIISDAWVWSNKQTMGIYCNTYNYVLEQLNTSNGKYLVHYESGVTDNIYDNKIPVVYINLPYKLDRNRRILEKPCQTNLGRICGARPAIDIHSIKELDLPIDPI